MSVCVCVCVKANIKSEVGKLIQTLCALLCMDEEDHTHYSLYVEGTPFTQLAEVRVQILSTNIYVCVKFSGFFFVGYGVVLVHNVHVYMYYVYTVRITKILLRISQIL